MYDRVLTTEQILALLADGPRRLAALTAGVPADQLQLRPSADEWSLNDILAHLRACGDMWGGYIQKILAEDHPTFRAVNPTNWIQHTNYPELQFRTSLRAFTRQRAALLAVLGPLPPKAWARSALVTGAGKPRERSVYSYAQWLANHEQSHLRHITRVVNAMHA